MPVTVTCMLRKYSVQEADEVFDALGNPVRRQIVGELGQGPLSVGELADRFAISRPAISRHLAQLEQARLVVHVAAGTRHVYRLEAAGFEQSQQWLSRFWSEAEARFRLVAENLAPAERSGD